ncbi:type I restriction enzyme S subunit [Salinibacter ruber]|uniref:restriction endonuclease subunit S n=1 Tax=Salinibacter ruber TaxID=146919 RepID=UPI00216A9DF4|nr:restriction endonuclease subunit S [Salinibacter ruber]MCS3955552.1 type I restriction enzyme S subunit [Salinibacter ruber]
MAASPYQSYRSSDVRGLDQIPAHWEEERAKHFFRPVDERSETGEEQLLSVAENRGVELRDDEKVNMRKAESYEGYKLCQPGDLVINSMWAWKRGLGISDYSGIISTAYSVFRLRDSSLFEEKYLDWLLRTDLYVGEYLCRSQGVWKSRLTLSDREFLDIPIIRPPIEEQRAIVKEIGATLDDIEAYITRKRKLIDLLETQRRAVINRAVTRGLDDGVEMKGSGIEWLGEIPAHWDSPRLKRLCTQVKDGLHQTPTKVESGVPFISTQHVRHRTVDWDSATYINREDYEKHHPNVAPAPGDVLITLVGSIGFPAIVDKEDVPFSCTRHVGYVRPKEGLLPEYLAYYFESSAFKTFVDLNVSQTAQPSIYLASLSNHHIPLPPVTEQKRIVTHLDERISEIGKAIDQAERQIELMEQYRTSLVAEVVTGQVDVRDAVTV